MIDTEFIESMSVQLQILIEQAEEMLDDLETIARELGVDIEEV